MRIVKFLIALLVGVPCIISGGATLVAAVQFSPFETHLIPLGFAYIIAGALVILRFCGDLRNAHNRKDITMWE